MKKAFCLPIICFFCSINIAAQLPVGYFRAGVSLFVPRTSDGEPLAFPGFTIVPGLRTLQTEKFAVTFSVPITIGATYKSDAFVGIDLPLMVDLSFGSATGNSEKAKLGFLVGGGLAYLNVVNYYEQIDNERVHSEFWGYRFQAGVSLGKQDDGTRTLILANFGKSMADHPAIVVGLSLQLIMGNVKKHDR